MQPAFLFTAVLPPPSPCTEILARPDGPGAWRASDAHKSFVVKRIIWHFMLVDIFFYFLRAPMQQRIVLDHIIVPVPFQHLVILPLRRMLGPQSRYPDCRSGEGPPQRLYLADMAAFLPVGHGFVEGVGPTLVQIALQQGPVGVIGLYFSIVFFISPAPHRIGLRKQPSCVQGKYGDGEGGRQDMIGDNLVLDAEARRKDRPAREFRRQ